MYDKYKSLVINPPKLSVKKNAREVVVTTISCMCDNKHTMTFRKDINGEFAVLGNGSALSNWQMKGDYRTDLRWAADDEDWTKVFHIINTGTSRVESVKSR